MTIISPSLKVGSYRFLIAVFGLLILAGLFYIYQYNQLVNVRHRLASLEEAAAQAEVINTDLKNELYRAVDPVKLKETAKEKGLVLDGRPDYLSLSERWLSDPSY